MTKLLTIPQFLIRLKTKVKKQRATFFFTDSKRIRLYGSSDTCPLAFFADEAGCQAWSSKTKSILSRPNIDLLVDAADDGNWNGRSTPNLRKQLRTVCGL